MDSGTEQNYVVLARKWRPAQFSDIVGQHPIVRTLMNSIRAKRIHQAYLFTGSRGIGKTSIARIFAKAIRCENVVVTPPDAAHGIEWLKSCDQCASCREIAAGTSVDVIEIDGASNNGVEAVREIRENAKYMPATGSRKIYIIDEVHMLTTAAFNALLKTLEEPPAHVVFVFATTEPHKIPATILSRCQRFDFRRVTMAQIQGRLSEVMKAEGIQAEPAALTLIARAAEGGMRDAMSLLDQVISFSGDKISAQAVRDSVGLIESQTLLEVVSAIFARKPVDAIALVDQAYQRGHDLRVLTRSLIEFLHGAVLAKIGAPRSGNLELSDEEWKELSRAAEARSLEEIELIFQVLHHGLEWIARSPQPKVVLDVLIVKCATAEALVYVGQPAPDAAPAGGAGLARSVPSANASAPAAPIRQTSAAPEPAPAPKAVAAAHAIADALEHHSSAAAALRQTEAPPTKAPAVTPAIVAATAAPNASQPGAAPENLGRLSPRHAQGEPEREAFGQGRTSEGDQRVVKTTLREPERGERRPNASQPGAAKNWEGFIAHVRTTRPLLASILEHGNCESSDPGQELAISYPLKDAYYREQLQSRIYSEQLLTLSKEYFGSTPRIQIELKEGGESVAARREREAKERERGARAAAQNHPMILEAKALFGGELGPIELTDSTEHHAHP
jgi:DNA polymerase-3 subunit gamma/tau